MKIAIPVEDNQTEICPSFGRTSMFLIYDTETKEKKYLDNSGIDWLRWKGQRQSGCPLWRSAQGVWGV